jgi:hypothetical protein
MLCHPALMAERAAGRAWPWIGGAVALVVALIACWWLISLQVAAAGLEPAGDRCSWEDDPGSGPSGYGLERQRGRMGVWPDVICSGPDGEVHRGDHVDHVSSLQPSLLDEGDLPLWAASRAGIVALATIAGAVTVALLRRRNRRGSALEPGATAT